MVEKIKTAIFNPDNTFISITKVVMWLTVIISAVRYISKLDSRISNLEEKMPTEEKISTAIKVAFENQVPKMILQFDERYEKLPK